MQHQPVFKSHPVHLTVGPPLLLTTNFDSNVDYKVQITNNHHGSTLLWGVGC